MGMHKQVTKYCCFFLYMGQPV